MKKQIKFDVSGDYKYFLCGYEPYMMIEKVFVDEAIWYLSYVRTDVVMKYGAEGVNEYRRNYIEEDFDDWEYEVSDAKSKESVFGNSYDSLEDIFDEYDVEDFMDEHPNKTDIDLFTQFFNRLCKMNINICVFSSDNINIVFTNKTDFNVLVTNGKNVIAFGDYDYGYIDFSRVNVVKKEVFVYANGSLLLRKDVE